MEPRKHILHTTRVSQAERRLAYAMPRPGPDKPDSSDDHAPEQVQKPKDLDKLKQAPVAKIEEDKNPGKSVLSAVGNVVGEQLKKTADKVGRGLTALRTVGINAVAKIEVGKGKKAEAEPPAATEELPGPNTPPQGEVPKVEIPADDAEATEANPIPQPAGPSVEQPAVGQGQRAETEPPAEGEDRQVERRPGVVPGQPEASPQKGESDQEGNGEDEPEDTEVIPEGIGAEVQKLVEQLNSRPESEEDIATLKQGISASEEALTAQLQTIEDPAKREQVVQVINAQVKEQTGGKFEMKMEGAKLKVVEAAEKGELSKQLDQAMDEIKNAETTGEMVGALLKAIGILIQMWREFMGEYFPEEDKEQSKEGAKAAEQSPEAAQASPSGVLREFQDSGAQTVQEFAQEKRETAKMTAREFNEEADEIDSEITSLDKGRTEARSKLRDVEQELATMENPEDTAEGRKLLRQKEDLQTDIEAMDKKISSREQELVRLRQRARDVPRETEKQLSSLLRIKDTLDELVNVTNRLIELMQEVIGKVDPRLQKAIRGISVELIERELRRKVTITPEGLSNLQEVASEHGVDLSPARIDGNGEIRDIVGLCRALRESLIKIRGAKENSESNQKSIAPSKDAPVGQVREDADGYHWQKGEDGLWRAQEGYKPNSGSGYEGTSWSHTLMDEKGVKIIEEAPEGEPTKLPPAKDAPIGEMRKDKEGNHWVKGGDRMWHSHHDEKRGETSDSGFEGTAWSDSMMDQNAAEIVEDNSKELAEGPAAETPAEAPAPKPEKPAEKTDKAPETAEEFDINKCAETVQKNADTMHYNVDVRVVNGKIEMELRPNGDPKELATLIVHAQVRGMDAEYTDESAISVDVGKKHTHSNPEKDSNGYFAKTATQDFMDEFKVNPSDSFAAGTRKPEIGAAANVTEGTVDNTSNIIDGPIEKGEIEGNLA
ncbi:hypothetical protein KKC44_01095 [Patescibacteria group bacterium]|nr:hypothetical protein [Patescibacteria group bacterium]MBU2259179.1 hypothetical protein [Patescibacteria group bacterium]